LVTGGSGCLVEGSMEDGVSAEKEYVCGTVAPPVGAGKSEASIKELEVVWNVLDVPPDDDIRDTPV